MDFAVILDPAKEEGDDGAGIRPDRHASIVAFQRFDKGFRHTVRLRAADRREEQPQTERACSVGRIRRDKGAAAVRQSFNGMRCPGRAGTALDGSDH